MSYLKSRTLSKYRSIGRISAIRRLKTARKAGNGVLAVIRY